MSDHTFVIPAYKNSPYLEQCVLSLLNQTVKSAVILCTSTPETAVLQIAQKYKLDYLINDKQEGIAGDWNFALHKATTRFVTIAHQDDIYESKYTEILIAKMSEKASLPVLIGFTAYSDLVANNIRNFSINAIVKQLLLLPFLFSKTISRTWVKKSILSLGDPICCPTVTLNMEELRQFRFSSAYTCALDWYAWYQIAKQKGSFMYVNKKLVKHRIHTASETTVQLNNGKRQQEEYQIFEIIWGKNIAKIISRLYSAGHKENLLS